jgi:hypothetical protein
VKLCLESKHYELILQKETMGALRPTPGTPAASAGKPSMKRPAANALPGATHSSKKVGKSASADANAMPPPTGRVPSKRSVQPPRHVVLNAVANMSGAQSGGKSKVIKQLGKVGIKASTAKTALKKLEQEGAIRYSQNKRTLKDGKKWRLLWVDKEKLNAARLFKI